MKPILLPSALLLVSLGCSAEPGVPDAPIHRDPASPSDVVAQGLVAEVTGFQHRALSRMFIGAELARDRSFEFDRIVGTDGVLAFGNHGVTLGVPNFDASSLSARPFAGNGQEHNEAVLKYFEESGLPSEQRGGVDVHAYMASAGLIEERQRGVPTQPEFRGYASVVNRQVEGIPIRGSYALQRQPDRDPLSGRIVIRAAA